MSRTLLIIAALSGFFAVALGAFGAHALKTVLSEDMRAVWNTGVTYQMTHTLALLLFWGLGQTTALAPVAHPRELEPGRRDRSVQRQPVFGYV